MPIKTISHSDSQLSLLLDITNASFAKKKVATAAKFPTLILNSKTMSKKSILKKFNSSCIGEKMIRFWRKSLTNFLKEAQSKMGKVSRKGKQLYRTVYDFFQSQKLWLRIMPIIVPPARTLYWRKSRCRFTKLLKYWLYA